MNIELIKELALCRKEAVSRSTERKAMLEAVTETKEYKEALANEKAASDKVAELEGLVRQAANMEYIRTQEKHFPGVNIRVMQKIKYDSGTALMWCWDNLKKAVSLNKTEFEKLAKNAEGLDGLNFVERYEEASAAIDSDLSQFIE